MLANCCSTFPCSISKCMQVVQLQSSNCSRPKLVFSPHLTPLWRWNKATTYGNRCHPFVTVHFNLSQFSHERVSYQVNPQNSFRSLINKMRVNVIKLFLPELRVEDSPLWYLPSPPCQEAKNKTSWGVPLLVPQAGAFPSSRNFIPFQPSSDLVQAQLLSSSCGNKGLFFSTSHMKCILQMISHVTVFARH